LPFDQLQVEAKDEGKIIKKDTNTVTLSKVQQVLKEMGKPKTYEKIEFIDCI
jgi:hypothetical protein